ncbi:hypothetical protein N7536_009020 [Penicillium majusculum]|nr:hypothetical protein N7536_009020 [Penicillium majusculum]
MARALSKSFSPKGLKPIEDIKKKGLKDVVFDTIAL